MAGYVILGMLAAFGLLCALWVMFGWLIPGGKGGCLVCVGKSFSLVKRLMWLREMGLLQCPLWVQGENLSEEERAWLRSLGIEICSLKGLELERNQVDGTGNGDFTGRDQRRGISEL